MPSYFSIERRRERLEDRLEDARDQLAKTRRFHRSFGRRASQIRGEERIVRQREKRLARFLDKHGLQPGGDEG
jgi:hypothetical protein